VLNIQRATRIERVNENGVRCQLRQHGPRTNHDSGIVPKHVIADGRQERQDGVAGSSK
jgi:hypothetical protein